MDEHSNQPDLIKAKATDGVLDLAIIGGGPAALTAALYAARAGLAVAVFDKQHIGGALTEISKIANYPGFVGEGQELAKKMVEQARKFGARIEYGTCEQIDLPQESANDSLLGTLEGARPSLWPRKEPFTLSVDNNPISARTVLIATGTEPRRLDLKTDKPVSYCARCDAPLYKGKNILVVGGGNSAVGESIYMADIVGHITLVNRSPLRAEPAAIAKLRTLKNVEIKESTPLSDELINSADAIFVFIGHDPATNFLPTEILDDHKYVITDEHYQTTIPGLYAAGDVRAGSTKQAIIAAGEGAAAAIEIINKLKHY